MQAALTPMVGEHDMEAFQPGQIRAGTFLGLSAGSGMSAAGQPLDGRAAGQGISVRHGAPDHGIAVQVGTGEMTPQAFTQLCRIGNGIASSILLGPGTGPVAGGLL